MPNQKIETENRVCAVRGQRLRRKEVEDILEVNDGGAFKDLLNSKLPVVVDYWASWCGPCHRMKPVFRKLAAKHSKVAKFASVNIDEHPTLSKSIESIPTFVVYSDGKSIGMVVGFSVFEKFESHILLLIKKANTVGDEAWFRERRRAGRPSIMR